MAVVMDTLFIATSTEFPEKIRDCDAPIDLIDEMAAVTKDCGNNFTNSKVTVTVFMGRCAAVLALGLFVEPGLFVLCRAQGYPWNGNPYSACLGNKPSTSRGSIWSLGM